MILTTANLLKLSPAALSTAAGGKGHNLLMLVRAGINVPAFLIITSQALEEAYLKHWRVEVSHDIENNRPDLAERIRQCYLSSDLTFDKELLKAASYAVRSSASDEDGEKSFAGQLNSYLNVAAGQIIERAFQVFASAFERRVLAYRKLNRLGGSKIPAVIVQCMVPAECAGVIFSFDPIDGNCNKNQAVLAVTRGLADKLVDGSVDGATYYIDRTSKAYTVAIDHLSSTNLKELIELLQKCEELFACAQDIEFALYKDKIYLLQARPITSSSPRLNTTDALVRVFDGSNIQESYPGITSPLTFSFIKSAYQEVYKSFCRLMGVSEKAIQAEADLFSSMLAYNDGRVYYNLASWYRLLALLPAYKTNRTFMEGMMGLSQSASELSVYNNKAEQRVSFSDHLSTTKAIFCIGSNYLKLESQIVDFNNRLDLALSDEHIESASLDELYSHYKNLQAKLLTNWQAPVTNDFFAMVSFGILNKLCAGQNQGRFIQSLLLQNHGGIISAAPAKIIAQIAALIASDHELCQAMINRRLDTSLTLLRNHKEAYKLYLDYLAKFGDRSIGELKLEVKSVSDDPSILLSAIGNATSTNIEKMQRSEPKEQLKTSLLVKLAASQTKQLLAQRENLRFARTRVFGRVRKIVLAMGHRLVEQNKIDCVDDIFYLTIDELLGFIDGTAVTTNLRALIVLRQEEATSFTTTAEERLVISGAVGLKQIKITPSVENLSSLKGLPASSGLVRGLSRVIRHPELETLLPGEILIADRTDPGWIVHFANCQGIVTAHGSLLSHTAIVARELGISAVVSCKGVMEQIQTGDLLEMDGSTGAVSILKRVVLKDEYHEVSA